MINSLRLGDETAILAQVVQEIKILRASVSQREREKAERATLKEQEKLVKAKASSAQLHNFC